MTIIFKKEGERKRERQREKGKKENICCRVIYLESSNKIYVISGKYYIIIYIPLFPASSYNAIH